MFRQLNLKEIKNKRVITREDLNVPTLFSNNSNTIISDFKIQACVSNVKKLIDSGAKLAIMTHFGRPKEGEKSPEHSVQFLAKALEKALDFPVVFVDNYLENKPPFSTSHVLLFENTRFNKGEKANSISLVKKYKALCDFYVFNAFAAAHRTHSSTLGMIKHVEKSGVGLLVSKEIDALGKFQPDNDQTICAIIGGSKVSTKFELLQALIKKVSTLIVGGGIANCFIAAKEGHTLGKSLVDKTSIEMAKQLLNEKAAMDKIYIPQDVVIATSPDSRKSFLTTPDKVDREKMILDIGEKSSEEISNIVASAHSILWNGPLGMVEKELFSGATRSLCKAIANHDGFSLIGGGETIYSAEKFNVIDQVSYASTGGGAFLEYLQGNTLPCIQALTKLK